MGDSLIEKIYEGIYESKIFIIVISKYSINSKWVKEELNSGQYNKIETGNKVMPIVIDSDLEIPLPLRHMKQIRIKNLSNYDEELEDICNSIFGVSRKPPTKTPPIYTLERAINGFEIEDTIVLRILGDNTIKNNTNHPVNFNELFKIAKEYDLSEKMVRTSVEVLGDKNCLSYKNVFGTKNPQAIKLSSYGLNIYSRNFMSNHDEKVKEIVSCILNDEIMSSKEINNKTSIPKPFINAIFEIFDGRQYFVKLYKTFDDYIILGLKGTGERELVKILEKN